MSEINSSSKINFLNELSFRNILELFLLIVIVVIFLRFVVLDISRVSSDSMEPVLFTQDVVLVSKIPYFFGVPNFFPIFNSILENKIKFWYNTPKINDIVVFYEQSNNENKILIKRISAIQSDSVLFDINTQKIRLDNDYPFDSELKFKIPQKDEKIKIDYLNRQFYLTYIKCENKNVSDTISEYVFEYNYYFVSGDNSQVSRDSREFGLISENRIIGKAVLKLISIKMNTFFELII